MLSSSAGASAFGMPARDGGARTGPGARRVCEHVFVTIARAFHDRLLELLPVYTTAGQRLAQLDPGAVADNERLGWALADRALRVWLRDAIPSSLDRRGACVDGLEYGAVVSDAHTVMDALAAAGEVASVAEATPGSDDLVTAARLAEAVGQAAARHDDAATGRAAADLLYYRRRGAGDEYVISEAERILRRQS
jgi:hypothetical protein